MGSETAEAAAEINSEHAGQEAAREPAGRPAGRPDGGGSGGDRIAVVVLGMHRAGTSALTRVLGLLGCAMPENLMGGDITNETGHWESVPVCELNDRVLEAANSSWDDWRVFDDAGMRSERREAYVEEAAALLGTEFGDAPLFAFKDPRVCRMLPFWRDAMARAGIRPVVVFPLRNPLEVAASLTKRNWFEPELGLLLWLRHVLDAEHYSRDLPRSFTAYDGLLHGWRSLASSVSEGLGIDWPGLDDARAAEIDAYLSDSYRHHKESPDRLLDDPRRPVWLRETYGILMRWVEQGEDPADHARLDSIRQAFNDSAPAFDRLVSISRGGAESRGRMQKRLQAINAALDSAIATAAPDADGATAVRLGSEAEEIAWLKSRLDAADAAVARVRNQARSELLAAREAEEERRLFEEKLAEKSLALARANRTIAEKDLALRRSTEVGRAVAEDLRRALRALLTDGDGAVFRRDARLRRKMESLRESGLFDAEFYLECNTDVAEAGDDPLRHYLLYGFDEGRSPNAVVAEAGTWDDPVSKDN